MDITTRPSGPSTDGREMAERQIFAAAESEVERVIRLARWWQREVATCQTSAMTDGQVSRAARSSDAYSAVAAIQRYVEEMCEAVRLAAISACRPDLNRYCSPLTQLAV
jgi:hypothetical protein